MTNTQVSKLRKAFANGLLASIKLSKNQLHKIVQSWWFLGRLLGPLLKTGLPLIRNVLKPLAESVLIPWELTAAAATDADIYKKMFGSGNTTLIISSEEINDIMKIIISLNNLVYIAMKCSILLHNLCFIGISLCFTVVKFIKLSGCFVCFSNFSNSLLNYKTFSKIGAGKFHFSQYEKLFNSSFFLLFKLRNSLSEI